MRFICESYLEMVITFFLHSRSLYWETKSDQFASIVILCQLVFYLIFPFLLAYILLSNFKNLNTPLFMDTYGDLYKTQKTQRP